MEEQPELSKRERKRLNREKKREEELKSKSQSELIKKGLFIGLVVLAAAFIWNALQGGGSSKNSETETPQISASDSTIHETDHVKGNPEAQLVLIEYGDFQCPACAGYYQVVKQVEEKYSDKIAIAYRQFPLKSIHRNAQMAAQASEAAAKQDKFWEMHDLLFERQDDWSEVRDPRSDFISYAKEIGLDEDQFASDMNSDEVKSVVDQSFNEAVTLGINSTPTFILNGEKLSLGPSLAAFSQVIDSALENLPQDDSMMESESSDSADLEEQL